LYGSGDRRRNYAVASVCIRHSHSIILAHRNTLITAQIIFLRGRAPAHEPPKMALLISKENLVRFDFARPQQRSTAIASIFQRRPHSTDIKSSKKGRHEATHRSCDYRID
jgi:hypothetical protein